MSRNTPLHLAAKFGYLEIIKTMVLADGFDVKDYVNDQEMDPFLVAVIFQQNAAAEFLADYADLTLKLRKPFRGFCKGSDALAIALDQNNPRLLDIVR